MDMSAALRKVIMWGINRPLIFLCEDCTEVDLGEVVAHQS